MALSSDDLYEKARSAGLSHATAEELAGATYRRGPLSGRDWPDFTPAKLERGGYTGPAPTIDSALWLRKVGMALRARPVMTRLASAGLPIVTNFRVALDGWESDGRIALDLEHRHVGGRREFTRCRVPVSACLNHDTGWVIAHVLSHLGGPTVKLIESSVMNDTDLRFVAG